MTAAQLINVHLNAAMKLNIKGVPEDSFTINVGKSKDIIGLQYNVHFSQDGDQPLINMKCIKDGMVIDHHTDSVFPFQLKKQFEVTISFSEGQFQIHELSSQAMYFKDRLVEKYYDNIWVDGNVSIKGISIS